VNYTTSCNTQSSAPENGRDQRPKHVDLIGIINKRLLLHLVGVYIIFTFPFSLYFSVIICKCKFSTQRATAQHYAIDYISLSFPQNMVWNFTFIVHFRMGSERNCIV